VPILPDLLRPGLKLVVCGSAVGTKSAERGAYYAGPGNRFWPILHETGATPIRLDPLQYPRLLEFDIGLTDMAKEISGPDSILLDHHFDALALAAKVKQFQPGMVAFNGKRAAMAFFDRPVEYGYQAGEDIGDTRLFVAPSTSAAARRFWDAAIWHRLVREAGLVGQSGIEKETAWRPTS
jgi:TDG/mug DNA glycosylase family protein